MKAIEAFLSGLSEVLGDGFEDSRISTDYQKRIVRVNLADPNDWIDVDISAGRAPTVVITWRGMYMVELVPDSNSDAIGAIEDAVQIVAGIVSGRYIVQRARWSERMVDHVGELSSLTRHRDSFIPWILPGVLFQGFNR